MNTTQTVVLVAHTFIAVMIIVLVLLQRGKGADAGAAFGAGASGTVFGARGSTSFFSRATAVLAAAFFASSLTLAYLSSQRSGMPDSLIENAPVTQEEEAESSDDAADGQIPALPAADSGDAESPVDDSDIPVLEQQPADAAEEPTE